MLANMVLRINEILIRPLYYDDFKKQIPTPVLPLFDSIREFCFSLGDKVLEDVRMHLTAYPGMQIFWLETLDMYPSITSGLLDYSRQVIREINNTT